MKTTLFPIVFVTLAATAYSLLCWPMEYRQGNVRMNKAGNPGSVTIEGRRLFFKWQPVAHVGIDHPRETAAEIAARFIAVQPTTARVWQHPLPNRL